MGVSTPATKRKKRKHKKNACAPVKKKHPRKKKAPNGGFIAAKKKKRKPHRCKRKKKKPVLRPGGTHPAPSQPTTGTHPGTVPPVPNPPKPPRLKTIASPIGVYEGAFGPRQAERLLWRAGFGPRPG